MVLFASKHGMALHSIYVYLLYHVCVDVGIPVQDTITIAIDWQFATPKDITHDLPLHAMGAMRLMMTVCMCSMQMLWM